MYGASSLLGRRARRYATRCVGLSAAPELDAAVLDAPARVLMSDAPQPLGEPCAVNVLARRGCAPSGAWRWCDGSPRGFAAD